MPLSITKIAFRAQSVASLKEWLESHDGEALMTTRYLPKRHEEMAGGSLYWIHEHAIVGRSPILGFAQRDDGRWWIRLEPKLIPVQTIPRRAHQGWRYLEEKDAPPDLGGDIAEGDVLPPRLIGELAKLGLV
ncbi:MAG: DUF1489 domain-containing protein [Novosphingobium sp.]|nr:DUF1489 domain-containing protein [Novosphingobium sp.]